MRILWVSSHLPVPGISGGRLREWELIRRLSREYEIYLGVASKTCEEDRKAMGRLEDLVSHVSVFPSVFTARFCTSEPRPDLEARNHAPALVDWLDGFLSKTRIDVVHVENAYVAHHLPPRLPIPLVVAEHNIESEVAMLRWSAARTASERTRWSKQAALLKIMEKRLRQRASKVIVVSRHDRERLSGCEYLARDKIAIVPNGISRHVSIDPTEYSTARLLRAESGCPVAIFVGNFAYQPNIDALRFLSREIMPALRSAENQVGVWIVGDSPSAWMGRAECNGDIRVVGRVRCTFPWLAAADLVIIPVRIGGGVKIKTLEAIRAGQAIVSTSVGVEGIPVDDGDVLVADDAQGFANAMRQVAYDESRARRMRLRMRALRKKLPTWDQSAQKLAELYDELMLSGS